MGKISKAKWSLIFKLIIAVIGGIAGTLGLQATVI